MPKLLQVASTEFNCVAYFHGGQLESTPEGGALLRALAHADGSVHALAARLRLQIAPEEVQCADAVCMAVSVYAPVVVSCVYL